MTEEEIVAEPDQAVLSLSKLLEQKDTLMKYKDLLEMEREVTLKRQFARFMNTIGISEDRIIDEYYPRFRSTVSVVEEDDKSIKDRMIHIVESDFLFDLMRLKTASRERELRRITKELSSFMTSAAIEAGDEDSLFLQRLLSRSLASVANEIDPKENRTAGQPMTEAWISAMKDGMDAYLTSLGE
jgi:hypothetical protein